MSKQGHGNLSSTPPWVPDGSPSPGDSSAVINNMLERTERKLAEVSAALEESVKLQSHYAGLLNQYDGGLRMQFKDAKAWLDRLAELKDK